MLWDANTLMILTVWVVGLLSARCTTQRGRRNESRKVRGRWAYSLLAGLALAIVCPTADVWAQPAPGGPAGVEAAADAPVADQPAEQAHTPDESHLADTPGKSDEVDEAGTKSAGDVGTNSTDSAHDSAAADEAPADTGQREPAATSASPAGKAPTSTSPAGKAAPAEGSGTVGGWRDNGWATLLVVFSVLVLPFLLAGYLASSWRLPEYRAKLSIVLLTLFAGLAVTIMGWPPKLGIDLRGGVILVYEVQEDDDQQQPVDGEEAEKAANAGRETAVDMDKLIAAVSRRINPGGVKEVAIRKYGAGQIEIIIPEVDEPEEVERIKDTITRIGTLEFRILANTRDHKALIDDAKASDANRLYALDENGKPELDRDGKPRLRGWWVPVGINEKTGKEYEFPYPEIATRTKEVGGQKRTEILVVKDIFDVTGGYLRQSTTGVDQRGRPCVNFRFKTDGGRLFRGLTGDNLPDETDEFKRKLAIILDGYLFSAPSINSTIGERGIIEGDFDQQEVEILVSVLNAGSLPATLNSQPASQLATGPTLGSDTVRRGRNAMVLSMLLVLAFMIFYYRFAGVVACAAMLANLVLILGVMIAVHGAFTLPGLAGLVLTVGMAVDANVLVFERIREEIDRGATLRMAIRNGFSRATTTIVDANLTTLITATVLYAIGSDQVKGFAFILWLGVVLSMYTAIFCSRLVFDIAEKKRWLTELKMRRLIGGTKIDFLGKRWTAAIVSLAVILLGLAAVFGRGRGLLDIDFTGGVSVQTMFREAQDVTEIRRQLSGELEDLAISDIEIPGEPENRRFMINTSIPPNEKNGGNQAQKYLDEVRRKIYDIYGSKLAHYSMTWAPLEAELPGGSEPGGSEPGEPPAEPATEKATEKAVDPPAESQSGSELPASMMLASTDPAAILLAQAEPAEKKASEEPGDAISEKPGDGAAPAEAASEKATVQGPWLPTLGPPQSKPQAKPENPAREVPSAPQEPKPAEMPNAARGAEKPLTRWTLDFGAHKMSYNALADRFAAEMGADGSADLLAEFKLTNSQYAEDLDREGGHSTWDVAIELPPEKAETLLAGIQAELEKEPYFPSSNTIGGKVAGNTQVLAVMALLASLVGIVAYIWFRFQRVMFALAAVVALVHDVLITLGVIALSAYVANFLGFLMIEEFKIGLSVLAAFLTIIGYSLNDTIVVFDRIREVRGKAPELTEAMINQSINQTLARTLLTSLTTLIVVVILYFLGGQGIHAFAFSLVVGVVVGTYSSIYIASPVLLWMTQSSGASAAGNRASGR